MLRRSDRGNGADIIYQTGAKCATLLPGKAPSLEHFFGRGERSGRTVESLASPSSQLQSFSLSHNESPREQAGGVLGGHLSEDRRRFSRSQSKHRTGDSAIFHTFRSKASRMDERSPSFRPSPAFLTVPLSADQFEERAKSVIPRTLSRSCLLGENRAFACPKLRFRPKREGRLAPGQSERR